MSNLGKWNRWYELDGDTPTSYGSTDTYELGAEFLADVEGIVEDWGCGRGYFRTLVAPDRYRGIDGSVSRHADLVVDLVDYRSDVAGIFLRHVLEHDYRWKAILKNAAESAREKLVVVLFTPMQDETREIAWNDDPGVPDIGFALDDLLEILSGFDVDVVGVASNTQYDVEVALLARRKT